MAKKHQKEKYRGMTKREFLKTIAAQGGAASRGGFATMDPELARELSSKGGKKSKPGPRDPLKNWRTDEPSKV